MHRLICRTLGVFILLSLSLPVFAQTAQFQGRVSDPQQAVVVGADVRIVNQATGVERRVKTNADGIYIAPFVTPGTYQVFVQSQGFSTAVSKPLTVTVGQTLVFDVQLKVGGEQQEVTVDAGSQMINTTDATVSTVIDRKFVENIPLNGRSFQDLISMTPGVVTQSPQAKSSVGYNGDFSVNGQRTESNYYTVDGVSANVNGGSGFGSSGANGTVAASTALGTTQSLLSVDAMQEFRVQSSTYSAEYGNSPGGQFSLVSRSGTNSLHGTIFDYLRNNFFDANDWFNDHYGDPAPPLRQNDFGATIGGPLLIPRLYDGRKKSFFFFSYEGLRLIQPQAASIQYVPDTALRQAAPTVLQPILNAYPMPTQGGIDYGMLAQFIKSYSLPSQIDSISIRLDHNITSKWAVFFRFANTPSSITSRLLSALTTTSSNNRNYTVGSTTQFTPTITNEFRLGYVQSPSFATGRSDSFGGAVPTNISQAMGTNVYTSPELIFYLSQTSVGTSTLSLSNSSYQPDQWNIVDTISIAPRSHTIKTGVDYRRMINKAIPYDPLVEALYLNTQAVTNNSSTVYVGHYLPYRPVFNDLAVFAQDEWRVSSSVHLSLGMRWELDPPPTDADGNSPYTVLGNLNNPSSLSLAPRGTPLWNTAYANFAPRLGMAWIAHGTSGWQTVLRMGGGVFFDSNNKEATAGYNGIGFSKLIAYPSAALPVTPTQLNFSPTISAPYSPLYVFPSHLQLPYTLQWNTSLEQSLGRNQAFTLSYVGANGRRLMQERMLSVAALNKEFGSLIYYPTGITSSYNALQGKFERSVTHGIHALASYTWSHSLDFGSNYSSLPATRGNADFDVRNVLSAGMSWDLPTTKKPLLARALLNDWGIDAHLNTRGAFPVTLQGKELTDPTTGNQYYGNVDIVANEPFYLYGPQYPGGKAINGGPKATNPAIIVPTSSTDAGDAPRNFIRGFGLVQVNMAARRSFPLCEQVTLQFRAEAFNILNHPNFGYVDPTLTDATFGTATKMLDQSLGTLASQYQQGGPRSMQFALKIIF